MTQVAKVHYRPIEAAIRWSGLVRHENLILDILQSRRIPEHNDFPRWPSLRLNAERIDDAIVHGELPSEVNGTVIQDKSALNDPNLTVRHVELKSWMIRYYPVDRPAFLFSHIERIAHPVITIDAVNVLALEREAFKVEIEHCHRELQTLRRKAQVQPNAERSSRRGKAGDSVDAPRNETTYLHIVGGLLTLLLGQSPSGKPYSNFRTQEAIIDALMAHHAGRLGITERTLQAKFAEAKRRLAPN